MSRKHYLKCGVLLSGMDFVIVCIGEYLNVVVPIALVIAHVAAEHSYDRSIEEFCLAVGLRVVGARECIRDHHHHTDPAEELRLELASVVG